MDTSPRPHVPGGTLIDARLEVLSDSSATEAELIAEARGGCPDAFAELWTRHAHIGRRYARSFTSTLDPDDLVAASFEKILTALRAGGGPTRSFRPYLYTSIRNTAVSWEKVRRRSVALDDLEESAVAKWAGTSPTAEAEAIREWERSEVRVAFRTLPGRWQQALWYVEVEGVSRGEVGQMLGLTPNAVSQLLFRARAALRTALQRAAVVEVA